MNGEASVYYISYTEGRGVVLRVLHIALLANNPKITNMECLLFVSSGHINTVVNIYGHQNEQNQPDKIQRDGKEGADKAMRNK